jgi:hypothetical protein
LSYQPAITIKKALENIHRKEFLLPAIQREFVWTDAQICHLFDSLMQGYPIGSLLFWRVPKERSREYVFYEFLQDFHQRDSRHCEKRKLFEDETLIAILDGQQRLTALNIGLRGTHAVKLPRAWWNNPDAFPVRHLYLNLAGTAEDNDLKMTYDFRFLTPEQAQKTGDANHWFRVSEILDMEAGSPIFKYVRQHDLQEDELPFDMLSRLHDVIHKDGTISYFVEEAPDLDKVLNIFIRVNSGGTKLSYSDLLLSIATAQWTEIDAREEIHRFVDTINGIRQGFNFSKDVVLKAGLMLSGLPSIAFRVTNFSAGNMKHLEDNWDRIQRALKLAVKLFADWGFSSQTLSADSVLIPVAYYLYRRDFKDNYRTAVAFDSDREQLRQWVVRSLLKPGGIWGSGLDTLLLALRAAIDEHGAERFPVEALETAMGRRGKSLRFSDDEIDEILDLRYGDKRVFPLLSLLYPGFDFRNEFHVDHVFPRSHFTKKKLEKAGFSGSECEEMAECVERLANLQLLDGNQNKQKSAALPAAWMQSRFADTATRAMYCERHDLGKVPSDLTGFTEFYKQRRRRLKARLRQLIGQELEAVIN